MEGVECREHKEPIRYICGVDYQPLCGSCIPSHTADHVRQKQCVLISEYKEFKKELEGDVGCLRVRMEEVKGRLESVMDPRGLMREENLESVRRGVIEHVNRIFDEVKGEFQRIVELKIEDGVIDTQKETKEVGRMHDELPSMADMLESPSLIKQYYSRKQHYNNTILQLQGTIQQIRQTHSITPFEKQDIQNLKTKISQWVFSLVDKKPTHHQPEVVPTTIEYPPVEKEKTESVTGKYKLKSRGLVQEKKRKKCQFCGQQLEYLTELKKHLVCRVCGNKERNYVKRK